MSGLPRFLSRLFILAWAGYTALAQPGVPACWLEAHPCEVHIHFSQHQAETPHSHGYLLDLAGAQGAPGLANPVTPIGLLIGLLFSSQVLRELAFPSLAAFLWKSPPEPPPPRCAFSP